MKKNNFNSLIPHLISSFSSLIFQERSKLPYTSLFLSVCTSDCRRQLGFFLHISYFITRLGKFRKYVATQNIMYGHLIWGGLPSPPHEHVHDMFNEMFMTCSRHVHHMFTTGLPHVHHMFTTCSQHFHNMFTTCFLNSLPKLFEIIPPNLCSIQVLLKLFSLST